MTTQRRHPNVINKDELDAQELRKGRHHTINRRFGPPSGAQQLGGTLTELPPGARSFPFHFHCANEEALFVISGTGSARIGSTTVTVRAGDWISFPAGPDHAHQMINDGSEPLVYLCVSTQARCEVVGYPESNKLGVAAGPSWDKPWFRQIVKQGPSLDYWADEPNAND
ncbi:MAG: cupin domain-containing protein [Kofleriaceae bacterium]